MGISEESKGIHMYWLDKKTVLTERNIYFDNTQLSVSRLEGEEWELTETKTHNPPVLPIPEPEIPQIIPEIPSENDEDHSEPKIPTKHVCKLTIKLKEIMQGHAVVSNLPSAPKFTVGTQLPSLPDVLGDALEADEMIDWITLMEDVKMAQMSEMEALEPPSLAVVKQSPDWPSWEKAIYEELAVLKAAGTWKMVNAPEGANIIGSKWVFQAKKDAAGIVV